VSCTTWFLRDYFLLRCITCSSVSMFAMCRLDNTCSIQSHTLFFAVSQMTLKFFSLFFWQVCKLNPVAVSSISLAAPLCISVAAATCQRLSPRCLAKFQLLSPPLQMFKWHMASHHKSVRSLLAQAVMLVVTVSISDLPSVAGEFRLHSPRHH